MVWWATGCAVNEQTKIKIRSTSVGHKCFPLTGWSAYLSECPLGGADLIHHPKWNADHGGESKQPADHISPPRVHILIVVLQRSVFNEGECKGALQRQGNRVRQLVRINLLYFLFFVSLIEHLLSFLEVYLLYWDSQCTWQGRRTTNSTWYTVLAGNQSYPQCYHKSDQRLEKHDLDASHRDTV